MEHGFLDIIGKAAQVDSQPIEQFSFCWVRSDVPDQRAFGCVREAFPNGIDSSSSRALVTWAAVARS
jgi:hypothetical protein